MKRKWRDARGETLVEVLASILIAALSVALLFSAVLASARMERSAEQTDDSCDASVRAAEEQDKEDAVTVPDDAKVTVKNKDPLIEEAAVPVNFYGGNGVVSYALQPAADKVEGGEGP